MSQDYIELNDQLKHNIISLLHEWLPGGRVVGSEYECADIRGGKGRSLKVNIETTLWSDFAGRTSGGDLISLYSAIKGIGQYEAFQVLAALPGINLSSVSPYNPKFPKNPDEVEFPPEVHEPPLFRLGPNNATATWEYKNFFGRTMFYIARFDVIDDETKKTKKEFRPYSWKGGVWTNRMWPAPRPLYGLELLQQRPEKAVCLVEGEKACDAARVFLGGAYNVMTWPGGVKAIDKIDWSPLKGKDVLIWPDNDGPGKECGKLLVQKLNRICNVIKILKTEDSQPAKPEKWDAADSGFTFETFKLWAKPLVVVCEKYVEPPVESKPSPPKEKAKKKNEERSAYPVHEEIGFKLGGSGAPISNIDNCHRFLSYYNKKEFEIWYDEFYQSVFVKWPGKEARPWQDHDDTRVTIWAQKDAHFTGAKTDHISRAVQLFARQDTRNEPREWVESLKWDGKNRVPLFFSDYMGAEENSYSSKVSSNFWVSMIARLMQPGSKVDNMVILEGGQGAKKSTALSIIGGKWFTESDEKMGTKDFYQKIQGHLIIEIAELDSFQRSEVTTVKNILTQRVDKFRPPYGRNIAPFPRQCIFVGSTNDDSYLKDPTGARRFWPILTTVINYSALKEDREQLFAEAYQLYKDGVTWWEVPKEEAESEQADRAEVDPWTTLITDFVMTYDRVVISELMVRCLGLEISRLDRSGMMRVTGILKRMGWRKAKRKRIGGKLVPNEWERIKPLWGDRAEELPIKLKVKESDMLAPPAYITDVPPEYDF